MTTNDLNKLDTGAAKAMRRVSTTVPALLHGYVSPDTMKWLYEHAQLLATEIVQPIIGHACPEVIVSVDVDRKTRYGHYKIGRDGLGLAWRISINVLHLTRARGDVVRTLLHEILHAVQHASGEPGKGNYHNKQFLAWCEKAGIPTNSKGHDQGTTPGSPFAQYCERHQITGTEVLLAKKDAPKPPGSKLKKWSCGCTNVRVAVADFDATCNLCGAPFKRAEGK